MSPAPGFSSVKASRLKSALMNQLGYEEVKDGGKGDHCKLRCPDRPQIIWGFGNRELAPHEVKMFLTKQVRLTLDEAKELVEGV